MVLARNAVAVLWTLVLVSLLAAGAARATDMTYGQLGAHASHTRDNRAHNRLPCDECHALTCSAGTGPNIAFGTLASAAGASPAWDLGTRSCSNVYCHGKNVLPLGWTYVDTSVVRPLSEECAVCHGYPPASPHPQMTACQGCHGSTVLADGTVDLAGGRHLNGALDFSGGGGSDCAACHGYPPATGAHAAHFGLSGTEAGASYTDTRSLAQRYPDGLPPGTPAVYAFGCANCHSVDASRHFNGSVTVAVYEAGAPADSLKARASASATYGAATGCSAVYCHGTAQTTPPWGSAAKLGCNGCHGTTTADGAPDYASGSPKANSHNLHRYACNTCHAGTTADGATVTDTALHVNGSCDVAPGAGVSFDYTYAASGGTCRNISCHFGGTSTWGPTQSHTATLGTGEVLVFSNDNIDHGAGFGIDQACTGCHFESLVAQHGGNCDLCHGGDNPAGAVVGSWNRTCSQASCHPSIHTKMRDDHNGIWWNSSASCSLCHDDQSGNFPGPANKCANCHDAGTTAAAAGDHEPPVTTSNAQASYVGGDTRIHLTATDAGSGASLTYYNLDGGGWTIGTDPYVPKQVRGSTVRTLQFYSLDHALNVEAPKTVTFTVAAPPDSTPPATACDVASGGTLTALYGATVTLTATDDGGWGVQSTYYKRDGDAWVQVTGRSPAKLVTQIWATSPATGSLSHTISWYSVDYAGNREATKSVTFTVRSPAPADTTAPVTTSSFNPAAGAAYKASQTVALSASDAGTGVKATYYRVDAAAWTAGTSFTVAGEGLHTFSWYSVDNANNTEATHVSSSFRIDATAPVTTSTAVQGTAYSGPKTFTLSASDTGSGVASTWYKLDTGAFTLGTSATVAAPASGSASHTLSWYSLDVAGNQEVAKSTTFTVQAAADATPPTTASSFNPAAGAVFKASQGVTLTASDNAGGTGVKATYYRVDAGAWTAGTSFTVAGEGLHTFGWYSVDNANNSEAARTSSQFRIDTVAPVTTSSAVSGTSYGGSQTFSLTASDTGGSGVASTWYKLDAGALTQGTSVAVAAPASGSASHTLVWYSVDVAGNREAERTATFTVAAGGAAPTTLTAAVYSGDMHPYAHFVFYDALGQVIADSDWTADEHYNSYSVSAPAGVAYTLYAEWEIPDYEGGGTGSDARSVSPTEASAGGTVFWQTGP